MIAGILNEIIEIYVPEITRNEVGEQNTNYVLKCKTRARIIHNSGNRTTENNEVVYNYIKTFQVRSYIEISDFDRIKWNDKYYRILNIEPNKQEQQKSITTELVNE